MDSMTEKRPDHETIEAVLQTAPKALIAKLGDSTETRRAVDHINLAYDYARQAREKAPRDESAS
jgi:hypothetical protein